MNEKDLEKELPEMAETEETVKEFVLDELELSPLSSAEMLKTQEDNDDWLKLLADTDVPQVLPESDLTETAPEEETDPIFAELARPSLPELEKENRARLQMQSPNRLYFYWSIKNNPFQTLQKVFGANARNYQLVARLVNQNTGREEIHAIEAEGNWWYSVESDADYRAEIGFFAPNRPFVRVMFSNMVETPRKAPSPRIATDADWAISANTFAEVLDISGFTRDAFEVALAGDDFEQAETSTDKAFHQLTGTGRADFNAEEVRYALLALASGLTLDELRGHLSEAFYELLRSNLEKLSMENALAALKDHFDVFDEEIIEEETIGPAVFGASLVSFPKNIKKRAVPKTLLPKGAPRFVPQISPISSLRF